MLFKQKGLAEVYRVKGRVQDLTLLCITFCFCAITAACPSSINHVSLPVSVKWDSYSSDNDIFHLNSQTGKCLIFIQFQDNWSLLVKHHSKWTFMWPTSIWYA